MGFRGSKDSEKGLLEGQWNPKYGCQGTVTTRFALIALVAWQYSFDSGKKKSTKINFLGTETARWGGGLPLEGVVAENFVPALESLSSMGFEERNLGCPGNLAGMSRTPGGVQKVCAKNFVCIFRSLLTVLCGSFLCTQSTVEMVRFQGFSLS